MMRSILVALLITCIPLWRADAQPAVDSSTVARVAYREAMAAIRAGDHATARDRLRRAAAAWPTQGAYVLALARVSAALGDTGEVAAALGAFADLGMGAELAADPALEALRGAPAVADALARVAANRSPLVRGAVAFRLADAGFFPEAIAADARTGSLYLSGIHRRSVVERRSDGSVRTLVASGAGGLDAAAGLAVDTGSRVLWVSSSPLAQAEGGASNRRAALLAFDLDDGRPLGRWEPPAPLDSTVENALGDLTVAAGGEVFVSDTRVAAVYRLRRTTGRRVPDAGTLEPLARGPLVRSPQGLAVTPRGDALLVADYSHGILRISLADGGTSRLEEPRAATTLGVDGVCLHGRTLYGVQNGVQTPRVVAMTLDAGFTRIERVDVVDRQPALAPEPTTCVVHAGALYYVANSQWEQYGDDGRPIAGAVLSPPTIVRVPLAHEPARPVVGRTDVASP